jgi:hypothetical protein
MFAGQNSTRSEVAFARDAISQPAESVLRLAPYTNYQEQRTQRK